MSCVCVKKQWTAISRRDKSIRKTTWLPWQVPDPVITPTLTCCSLKALCASSHLAQVPAHRSLCYWGQGVPSLCASVSIHHFPGSTYYGCCTCYGPCLNSSFLSSLPPAPGQLLSAHKSLLPESLSWQVPLCVPYLNPGWHLLYIGYNCSFNGQPPPLAYKLLESKNYTLFTAFFRAPVPANIIIISLLFRLC